MLGTVKRRRPIGMDISFLSLAMPAFSVVLPAAAISAADYLARRTCPVPEKELLALASNPRSGVIVPFGR